MARRLRNFFVLVTLMIGCGDPQIIVPDVLSIVAILPSHGSVDVSTEVEALVYFSQPLASSNEVSESLSLTCLGASPCNEPNLTACAEETVVSNVSYDQGSQVARLVPSEALQEDTCYVFVVAPGLQAADKNVSPLPVEVRSGFKTR